MKERMLTRRAFLTGAAGLGASLAAAALTGCAAREVPVTYVLPTSSAGGSAGGSAFQSQTLRAGGKTCTLWVTGCEVDEDRNMVIVSLNINNQLDYGIVFNARGDNTTGQGRMCLSARTDGSPAAVTVLNTTDGGLAGAADNFSGRSVEPGSSAQGRIYLRADAPEWSALTLTVRMNAGPLGGQAVFCLSRNS